MNKRIALLLYRVARWLAPEYFSNRLRTIKEMRVRIGVLRERVCSMPRRRLIGREGRFVIDELQSLEGIYKTAAAYYSERDQYQLLRIEIPQVNKLSQSGQQRVLAGEKLTRVIADEQKRTLFEAVAAGLAQSSEIEQHIYHSELGSYKTVGIRLYLKDNDKQHNTKYSDSE